MTQDERNQKTPVVDDKQTQAPMPISPTDLSDDDLDQIAGGDSIDDGHEGG
jgi:hypothetical protein